jgi:diguanylate cyclase (GGDEF)-like protein
MGWLVGFVRRDLLRAMRLAFLVGLGAVAASSFAQIAFMHRSRLAVLTSSVVLVALLTLRVLEYRRERPVGVWLDVLELGGLFAVLVQVRNIDAVLGSIFFLSLFRSAVGRLVRLMPMIVGYVVTWLVSAWVAPEIDVYPGAVVSLLVVGPMAFCVRILLLRLREQHMKQSEMLDTVLRELPFPVLVADEDGAVVLANPAALALLGESPVAALAAARSAASGGEVEIIRSDGSTANVLVETVHMADQPGVVIALLDVTAQRMYEETLHRAAYYDSLTGLPNRALLWQHLEAADRQGEPYGMLLIDLDDFKSVNDTLGHHAGDELLRAVAGRLSDAAGPSALVARLGGDEFAALVPVAATETLAAALRSTFDTPFALTTGSLVATGTIGAAVARPDQSPDDVMAAADDAMYRAKPGRYRRTSPRTSEVLS